MKIVLLLSILSIYIFAEANKYNSIQFASAISKPLKKIKKIKLKQKSKNYKNHKINKTSGA